jgi:hypothetical protein
MEPITTRLAAMNSGSGRAKVKASHTGRYLALALRGEPIRSLE